MGANHALRRARQERGWSQTVVATKLDTSPKNVSRWECGTTFPSPYFRTKLCQLFSTDARALGLLAPEAVPAPTAPLLDPEIPRLALAAGQIIGRAEMFDELLASLQSGATCVLYGLPGIGKTTLAHLVSQHPRTQEIFPDGVLWISLGTSPIIHSDLLRLATLLGAPEDERLKARSTEALSQYVHHLLGERRLLIVIDDAWSMDAVLPLLIGGSRTAYLLTTRLPELALGLSTTRVLAVPELDAEESRTLLTMLAPTLLDHPASIVQPLLQYAGGLPLALTLLGHYLRSRTIGGQRRRMEAALAQLVDTGLRLRLVAPLGAALRPPPQPISASWSLESIIGISDHYLSPAAQQALRALSVLPAKPDRFSEAAALAVSGQSVELLDQLLDAGLLEGVGEGWYHLHQAISDYARLQRTEIAPLQHLIQYARQMCASTSTPDVQDLDAEYPVVLAALQAATTLQQSQDFIEIVLSLLPFWRTRGFYDQADRLLQKALEIVSASGDDAMQTRLLAERSQFAVVHENWEAAQQYAQAGLELASVAEQQEARALCLQTLGTVARQNGNLTQAREHYEEGLALARACVDRACISQLLSFLGGLVCHQGDYHLSECLHQEGLALARQDGNLELICQHLVGLGMTFQMQVDYAKAEQYLQEGLVLAGHLKYRTLQTRMLLNLGVTSGEQGDIAQSEAFFLEGLALARQSDDRREIKRFLMNLGAVALEQQAYERAEEYLREGLVEEQQTTDVISRVVLLINLGVLQGEQAREQEAQVTFEECVRLARDLGNPWLLSEALCSRGEVSLLAGQVDAAERWFQESLAVYQDCEPAQDNVSKAQFGLAKVAALLGRQEEARQMGEQCLRIFTELHHRSADEVRAWLDELPPITPLA